MNVDGAIGAILADLGMKQAGFNGIFMIARTPGLIAHVIEEQTRGHTNEYYATTGIIWSTKVGKVQFPAQTPMPRPRPTPPPRP